MQAAEVVSIETLRKAPLRLMAFLDGMSDVAIADRLSQHGWSRERCEEGIAYLELLARYPLDRTYERDTRSENVAACEALQAGPVVRARAMLLLHCPKEHANVFGDYVAGRGGAALIAVTMLMMNLQRLRERSKEGDESSRAACTLALDVLEDAGLGESVLAELDRKVDFFGVQTHAGDSASKPVRDRAQDRLALLRSVHTWLAAWSVVARSVITRRDQLIRLGLTKRRTAPARRSPNEPVVTASVAEGFRS